MEEEQEVLYTHNKKEMGYVSVKVPIKQATNFDTFICVVCNGDDFKLEKVPHYGGYYYTISYLRCSKCKTLYNRECGV